MRDVDVRCGARFKRAGCFVRVSNADEYCFVRAPERDQPDDRGFMRMVFVKELEASAG